MRKYRTFSESLKERFKNNPEEAQAYLEVALEEFEENRDTSILLKALRNVAEAQGGIPTLARKVGMNKQSLYKVFSDEGNPRLDTVGTILHGLGYRLSLMPMEKEARVVGH